MVYHQCTFLHLSLQFLNLYVIKNNTKAYISSWLYDSAGNKSMSHYFFNLKRKAAVGGEL